MYKTSPDIKWLKILKCKWHIFVTLFQLRLKVCPLNTCGLGGEPAVFIRGNKGNVYCRNLINTLCLYVQFIHPLHMFSCSFLILYHVSAFLSLFALVLILVFIPPYSFLTPTFFINLYSVYNTSKAHLMLLDSFAVLERCSDGLVSLQKTCLVMNTRKLPC